MRPVLAQLVDLLELERIEEDLFRGQSQDLGWGAIFGGQVLGQALSAATQTVDPERAVHSLHGYFLRQGDASLPVVYEVDRIRNGRSFTTRRVMARRASHDPPGGERPAVTDAIDVEHDRPHLIAGADEVAVQRMDEMIARHRVHRRLQRLRDDLAAVDPLASLDGAVADEKIGGDLIEGEQIEKGLRLGLRVFGLALVHADAASGRRSPTSSASSPKLPPGRLKVTVVDRRLSPIGAIRRSPACWRGS